MHGILELTHSAIGPMSVIATFIIQTMRKHYAIDFNAIKYEIPRSLIASSFETSKSLELFLNVEVVVFGDVTTHYAHV